MAPPEGTPANESDDEVVERPSSPPPPVAGTGPYPELLHYQLMTPRAPLPPGAGIRMNVIPHVQRPTVPAHWAEDPSGRHQWRWWNGRLWTEHVADDGEASTDPID